MDALAALAGLLLSALGLAIVWGLAASALQSGMHGPALLVALGWCGFMGFVMVFLGWTSMRTL